jgi:hypothetical protein
MDNGRNRADLTMLASGESPDPVRLWWARLDDDRAVTSDIRLADALRSAIDCCHGGDKWAAT